MGKLLRKLKHGDDAFAKEIIYCCTEPTVFSMPTTGIMSFIQSNKIDEMRVIFNNPTTILIANGKKYISKAHDEKFDEEKGLLMCLAKANGYTHANIKALLKSAQRQIKKK